MQAFIEPSRKTETRLTADVIVCGGGPAGIGAALSSARQGAKTVLIERYGFLGGMGTAGLVSSFAYGYHDKERFITGGIFLEFRKKLMERNALISTDRKGWEPFHPEIYKMLAYDLLQEAGVIILTHTMVVDVISTKNQLDAILIESKAGRQAIVGQCFIDATGDGDLAARGGVPYEVGRESDGAMQPQTMMYVLGNVDINKAGYFLQGQERRGFWKNSDGISYLNATGFHQEVRQAKAEGYLPTLNREDVSAVFTIPWLDGTVGVNFGRIQGKNALDPQDLTAAEIEGRRQVNEGVAFFQRYVPGFEQTKLVMTAPQVGVRETRRIMGEYIIQEEDIVEQRQFADVIAQSCYMIDIHSPDSDTTTLYKLPRGTHYDIPYRSLLPRNLNNLLLAGRCISATHRALGSFRVQAICLAIGEAAGTAAALSVHERCEPKNLNIEKLQKTLESHGAILS